MNKPRIANLASYLTDHLAGSVAAINLLTDLESMAAVKGLRELCSHLRAEIQADQVVLSRLISLIEAEPSLTQRCGAWVAEKITALRLANLSKPGNSLALMEAFELIALGIQGKRLLWRSLDYTLGSEPEFREFDFPSLTERAVEQFVMVEKWRMEMARSAFGYDRVDLQPS